jgi:hypothetical protein
METREVTDPLKSNSDSPIEYLALEANTGRPCFGVTTER